MFEELIIEPLGNGFIVKATHEGREDQVITVSRNPAEIGELVESWLRDHQMEEEKRNDRLR